MYSRAKLMLEMCHKRDHKHNDEHDDLKAGKTKIIASKKRQSHSGISFDDKRGRHGNQPRVSVEALNIIKEHIKSFPAYMSHYSRSQTDKKYLNPDLNISKMYRLYKDYCTEENITPQIESYYRKVFAENFNLSFHPPANDTCGKCDKYNILLKATTDPDKAIELGQEHTNHLNFAETAYKSKKYDKDESRKDASKGFVSFDLQKCLPTPFLQNNISFYKRSLWTLNLTVYSCVNKLNKGICYIWDETIAARGGQEIASCMRHFLLSLPDNCTEINMYSDCCPGQTRNIYFSLMLSHLMTEIKQKNRSLKVINHKFLEPGHTHLEADTIHAAIEKVKKTTTAKIELPRDWANLIRCVPRKPPLSVVELEQKDFYNFKKLLGEQYIHRKKNIEGSEVNWFQIRWTQYRVEDPTNLYYKTSLINTDEFSILDLSRKTTSRSTRRSQSAEVRDDYNIQLTPLNDNEPLPLPVKKINDLKTLLPFISISSRTFYESIATVNIDNDYLPDERSYDE